MSCLYLLFPPLFTLQFYKRDVDYLYVTRRLFWHLMNRKIFLKIVNMKKSIDLLVLSLITALIFQACNTTAESNSSSAVANAATATGNNTITFKVNGEEVKTTGWNIARFSMGSKVQLNITSNMHADKRTINVNLSGDKARIYNLSDGISPEASFYGSYAPDYDDLLTRYSFKEGEFDLTEIDTVKGIVNGTFKGKVSDLQGKSFDITDGKIINGELKQGIQKF